MAKVALHTEEKAVDTTNNDLYRKNPDGTYTRTSTGGADHVALINPADGTTLAVSSGLGIKVAEVGEAYNLWVLGDETTTAALTVSGGATPAVTSIPIDMSHIDFDKSSLWVTTATSTSVTMTGKVSRDGTNDLVSIGTLTGMTTVGAGTYLLDLSGFPRGTYLVITATNNDAANAATVKCGIMARGA